MKKLRWGLISTANINRRLIPVIGQSERGELAAVASRSLESANKYAKKWDIPQAFGSYQEMLDSGEVDVVYISLPNHLHAEWTIKALRAGVHVLCEKPFAITLDEVDEMVAVSEQENLVLAEAFMYRHHPKTLMVKDWIESGKLGEIKGMFGAFSFYLEDDANVRMRPEYGGGSLWDVGVYPMSYAQFLMGETPQWVTATQTIGSTGVDTFFGGHLHYENGVFAQIMSSFKTSFITEVQIYGTKGRVHLPHPFTGEEDAEISFYPVNGEMERYVAPSKPLYLGEVEDMHAAILDGKPNLVTLEETRNHVKTVLALYEAAKTGKQVFL